MNDPKAAAAYHPGDVPVTRPDLDALIDRATRLSPQKFHSPFAEVIRELIAALAAERARADHSQLIMAEAWDDGFDAGEGRGNRKIRSNPYRSASAAPTAEQ